MSSTSGIDVASLDGTYMTEAEFLALPELTGHVELIDGLVVCEPSGTFGHQRSSMALAVALDNWARTRVPTPTVIAAPLDIRFGPSRILQPDVLVYCDPIIPPVKMPLTRIPDLCIEIVSSRPALDRTTKRAIYAQAGVKEFWTVLREQRLVERWTGEILATREEHRETLVTPLLPGFALDVVSVVAD